MAQFKAFATSVQVNGETVLAVLDGMDAFHSSGLRILAQKGIVDPRPGQWYSQQAWLDAFQAISEQLGPDALFAIGQKIPTNAKWPAGVDSLARAFASIDAAYHMNHRGGEIGYYRFEKESDRSGLVICRNPYPCDFDRGIIDAIARTFKPQGVASVKLAHDMSLCRKNGDEACAFSLSW